MENRYESMNLSNIVKDMILKSNLININNSDAILKSGTEVKIIDGKFKGFDEIDKVIIKDYCTELDKYLVQIDKYNVVYVERSFILQKEAKNKIKNQTSCLTIKLQNNLVNMYYNDVLISSLYI